MHNVANDTAASIPGWALEVKAQCPWATVAHILDVAEALGDEAHTCHIVSVISEDLDFEDALSLASNG